MINHYFDNVLNLPDESGPTPEAKEQFEKSIEDQYALARAYNKTFGSELGQEVLRDLKSRTIEGTTWNWELGHDNAIANGFAREGQNSIYRYIEYMIGLSGQLKEKMDNDRNAGQPDSGS